MHNLKNFVVPMSERYSRLKIMYSVLAIILLALSANTLIASANMFLFSGADRWLDKLCFGSMVCKTGDFDGDGNKDVVRFWRDMEDANLGAGNVDVYLFDDYGRIKANGQVWHDWFCIGDEICAVGDVNNDGRDDIITFLHDIDAARGDVYVALSTGSSFGDSSLWHPWFCIRTEVCAVGDVTGDGRADIVTFIRETPDQNTAYGPGTVAVATSTGSSFTPPTSAPIWRNNFCQQNQKCFVANFNGVDGDGLSRADIIKIEAGSVSGALSTGNGFGEVKTLGPSPCVRNAGKVCDIRVDDYNNDGRDDLLAIMYKKQNSKCGRVYLSLAADGTYNPPYKTGEEFCRVHKATLTGG